MCIRDRLSADSGAEIFPMFYMFDAPGRGAEDDDEAFLAEMTGSPSSSLMYESKATVREEFEGFRNMFTLLGGVLCAITGLVGILNFFNSIMTGMMSRRREFAMLQSIGMTGKQLRSMLIYEGLLYAAGAILLSLCLLYTSRDGQKAQGQAGREGRYKDCVRQRLYVGEGK